MRISSAYIPAQVSRAQTSHPPSTADKVANQQRTGQDQYRKHASGSDEFIDAEYVEFYSPSKQTFAQERQRMDNRVEPQSGSSGSESIATTSNSSGISRYQLKTHEAPAPGTYIDTFA